MWRKNREPNPGSSCIGIDLNRDHSYQWGGTNGGSSADPCNETYRGPAPASSPEVTALQTFVDSRVVSGVQQIKAAISFHSYSELVLWPYGYTAEDIPSDMAQDDHAVFVAMGQAMAPDQRLHGGAGQRLVRVQRRVHRLGVTASIIFLRTRLKCTLK